MVWFDRSFLPCMCPTPLRATHLTPPTTRPYRPFVTPHFADLALHDIASICLFEKFVPLRAACMTAALRGVCCFASFETFVFIGFVLHRHETGIPCFLLLPPSWFPFPIPCTCHATCYLILPHHIHALWAGIFGIFIFVLNTSLSLSPLQLSNNFSVAWLVRFCSLPCLCPVLCVAWLFFLWNSACHTIITLLDRLQDLRHSLHQRYYQPSIPYPHSSLRLRLRICAART